ncbi:hypothetical protein J437_LFUL015470 [Ladona fulva]|uniref:Uncharacterized protein n=1 Tax=Ladona fulva TaxID=123851 RepID=A0A8K0KRS3_LADFU|nr:hypothetical protein J437_LFUL015470 [Ladona fulva]
MQRSITVSNVLLTHSKEKKRIFNNKDLSAKTKTVVFKAVVLSVLLYGNECWILYQKHVRALEKSQQRRLRSILGIRWQDHISNQEVLERANCKPMETILAQNHLRWLGHVCRMTDERLPKQILYGELAQGRRNPGGQLKRYKDVSSAIVKKAGVHDLWMCKYLPAQNVKERYDPELDFGT